MTKDDLEQSAMLITRGLALEDLSSDEIAKVMTVGQYLADRGLAEIERRGELEYHDGDPIMPYCSDHMIETILTRPLGRA